MRNSLALILFFTSISFFAKGETVDVRYYEDVSGYATSNAGILRGNACDLARPVATQSSISSCLQLGGLPAGTSCHVQQEKSIVIRTGCAMECVTQCELIKKVDKAQFENQKRQEQQAEAARKKEIQLQQAAKQKQIDAANAAVKAEKDRITKLSCLGGSNLKNPSSKSCMTSNNSKYEKYVVPGSPLIGVKDSVSGVVWIGIVKAGLTFSQATEYCNHAGLRLPTKEDFNSLVKTKGDKEVLNETFKTNLFWTSTMPWWGASTFNANTQDFDNKDPKNTKIFTRCVLYSKKN